MSYIRNAFVVFAVTALAGVTAAASQPGQPSHGHQMTVGQNVTLSSCVQKGKTADTFILTNVADVPVHPATMGRVVYWLDKVDALRGHVGHQVRIQGTITEVRPGEMEVKLGDDGKGGWTVEIEGPGRDVKTTPEKAGVDTAGRDSGEQDIQTTLVKLKVNEVVMVAPSCPTM